MTVELEKNMMTGMLTVLGKLVNRNAADKSYLVLRLEAKDGVLKFSTHSATEQLTYQMAVQCAESFTGYAEFDAFRNAVRSCRAKNVQLSCDENVLTVSDTAVSLTEAVWPEEEKDFRGITCTLPENFLGMCARAAQVIDRTEVRPALRGINLNREGITATSGREMIHFPCPLKVESLTIPLPLALLQSKCEEAGTLQFWPENMGTGLRMTVGPWEWQTRALTGTFPAWQKVIPAEEVLIRSVEISTESAAQLIASLRSQPNPDDKLSVCLQQANKESLSIQPDKLLPNNISICKVVEAVGNNQLSVKEMMQLLALADRENFLKNYLNPAIKDGFVRLLYPDSPRHPRQKYLLTVKGLAAFQQLQH